jgi:hypothetical protein
MGSVGVVVVLKGERKRSNGTSSNVCRPRKFFYVFGFPDQKLVATVTL